MINKALGQINFPALSEPEIALSVICPGPVLRIPMRPIRFMQQNGSQYWLSIVFNNLLASIAASVFVWVFFFP